MYRIFLLSVAIFATQSTALLAQGSKNYPAPTPGSKTVTVDEAKFDALLASQAKLDALLAKINKEPELAKKLLQAEKDRDAFKANALKLQGDRDDALKELGLANLKISDALKVIMEVKWQPNFPRDYTGYVLKSGGKAGLAADYFQVQLDKSFTFKGKEWVYSSVDRSLYEAISPPPSVKWMKK